MPIQILLTVALAIALLVTWKRVKEGIIKIREALLWTIVWIAAAVVVISPNTTQIIAEWLGVGRGVDLVLYASVIVLFFLVFKLFTTLDRLDRKLTDIVRKDALRDLPKREDEQPNNQTSK